MSGYRLHILSQGCCSPTVVFEAEAGSSSLVWTRVAPEVAGFARVVTYDRAGLGWRICQLQECWCETFR